MLFRTRYALFVVAVSCALGRGFAAPAEDLDGLEQQAFDQAVEAVADCIVQIQTVGGLDQIEQRALSEGPTTGLIISSDGYVVSSAFGFAQEPTSILVRLPDGSRRPAELIGRDWNRMLVLLKVDAEEPLRVPQLAPLDEVRPGDWALAVGRTYQADDVSISVGVISALNRMHGRVLQTDANVSAANYGGPLIDIQGRVLGVLVPMSPQQTAASEANAIAGSEYYDSGIGFAAPLEHTLSVLQRWKMEKDLHRGLLGVGLKSGNPHTTPPIITAVWPGSPAAKAGLKTDDRILAVDGAKTSNQTALRFATAPRYAGDKIQLKVRRGSGDDAETFEKEVELIDDLPAHRHAFLGVLPERGVEVAASNGGDDKSDEPENAPEEQQENPADKAPDEPDVASGVVVRAVWPDSPADRAGMLPGDRITRLGDETVASLEEALVRLNSKTPGDSLEVVFQRGADEKTVDATLAESPTEILSATDLPSRNGDDAENILGEPKVEELKLPEMPQTARYLQPAGEGEPPGLLIWLGPGNEDSATTYIKAWQRTCQRDRLILLWPEPGDAAGWSNEDLEYLGRLLQTALGQFTVDPRRIVIAGEGKGGQLAYAVAFRGRRFIRGVVTVDSPMPRTLEAPENSPNERLAVLSIETQDSPLSTLIRRDVQAIADAGYPATELKAPSERERGKPIDAATRAKIARWIDTLDRL